MRYIKLISIYLWYVVLLLTAVKVNVQQGSVTCYVYNNWQLRAILSPKSEAAIYDYARAGNFTTIRRFGPNDCEALEFTKQQSIASALVTIHDVGFGGQVSGVNFNGVAVQLICSFPSLQKRSMSRVPFTCD